MAKKETINEPKDMIEVVPEELEKLEKELKAEDSILSKEEKDTRSRLESWSPKTQIGKDVRSGKEKNIDSIIESRQKILEPEIADTLLHLETDLLLIGQAKGKFGGGKRRAWRQTQKKTMEGNVLTFSAMAVVGDKNGHVGLGYGKAKETLPAREKAIRKAKINIIKIKRGCAHFDCACSDLHTVPHTVEGKCGSARVTLLPAPQGTGLVIGDECKKILRLAGIRDVYSRTNGQIRTTFNFAKACMDALSKTSSMGAGK